MNRSLRIAIFSPYYWGYPTFGGESRIFNIAKSLAENGSEVHIFVPKILSLPKINVVAHEWKPLHGLFVYPYNLKQIKRLALHAIRTSANTSIFQNVDLIICEHVFTAWPALFLKLLKRKRIVIDQHNVEWYLSYQTGKGNWKVLRNYETFLLRRSDQILSTSHIDKGQMTRLMGIDESKIKIVSNGVDTRSFKPDGNSRRLARSELNLEDNHIVFFMGSLEYEPNIDAVIRIAKYISPETTRLFPNVTFVVSGRGSLPDEVKSESHINKIIHIGMPEMVAPYINAADVCISPLTKGSGTRIKILEFMACGKPVISTRKGVEGLDYENGRDIIIEDDLINYPKIISWLLKDDSARKRLGNNARKRVMEQYEWSVIGRNLTNILGQIDL